MKACWPWIRHGKTRSFGIGRLARASPRRWVGDGCADADVPTAGDRKRSAVFIVCPIPLAGRLFLAGAKNAVCRKPSAVGFRQASHCSTPCRVRRWKKPGWCRPGRCALLPGSGGRRPVADRVRDPLTCRRPVRCHRAMKHPAL